MKKLLIILLLLPAWAWGASESHTAASWDTTNTGVAWEVPGNVTGSGDQACASYSGNSQSLLIAHNFGFTAVTGTVDSIVITFDMYRGSNSAADRETNIQLTKTGGSSNTPVGDAVVLGGDKLNSCAQSADTSLTGQGLWNTTWSASDITASTFGVIMKDNNTSAAYFGFDAVTVTVYYTEAGGGTWQGTTIITGGN